MAQTQLRIRQAQVAVTLETTQDTYKAPTTGSDMVLAEDVEISFDSSNVEQNAVRSDGLTMDDVPGTMTCTISYSVRIKGSGTAGTAPDFRTHLMGCGMRESDNGTTDVTYYPVLLFDSATAAGPPTTENPGISYSCTVFEGSSASSGAASRHSFAIAERS